MEFKNAAASFDMKNRFSDDMKRFISEEAARFTPESNEAASASIDDVAEKSFRISAERHRGKAKEKIRELKEFKSKKDPDVSGKDNMTKSDAKFLDPAKPTVFDNVRQGFSKNVESGVEDKGIGQGKSKFIEAPASDYSGKASDSLKPAEKTKAGASSEKSVKAEKKKEQKKAASRTAVASMFRAKKEMSNDLVKEQVSGDALKDGNTGLLRIATEYLNPMRYVKSLSAKIGMAIAPYILSFMAIAAVVLIIISFLFSVLQPMKDVTDALSGFISMSTGAGGGLRNTTFSDAEIDEIIADSGADETQEKVIRFALSKVGYPYNQDLRTSGKAYDCSSLAYYSWEDAGLDISYGTNYPPTAAEGARMLEADGKSLSTMDLKPGDLIYYGGEANGRYLGIYHVAIYVGNGKAVEALSTKYGVVYQTLCTKNAIMVCRPNK